MVKDKFAAHAISATDQTVREIVTSDPWAERQCNSDFVDGEVSRRGNGCRRFRSWC